MFVSKSFITLGLASLPLAFAAIHDIQVGADGLSFTPEAISAEVGDQVVFHFVSKNHTATQSSFDSPCGPKEGGFNSGFMPVPQNQTDNLPIHTISVYDKNPIWVFCSQTNPVNHCGQGMVFAINCGADDQPNSFTNFKQSALDFGASLSASAAPSSTADAGAGGYGGGYGGGDAAPTAAETSATDASAAAPTDSAESSTSTAGASNSVGSTDGSTDEPSVIKVIVGDSQGDLTFNPSNISAAVGSTVVFEFRAKNHSVVQSSFNAPCVSNGGFKSDFFPVDASATTFPTFNVTVNDTAPIWAYCRQTTPKSHCGSGMVFSVNAVESSDKSFTAFQNSAEAQNGTSSNGAHHVGGTGMGMGMVFTAVAIMVSLL
ncbi:hypothetical protein VKT23_005655 [Stygiomarasmius scandens]|uniref:Cupredoxin n=1 Tax=Marasmiellus scandens TaxID=2682957 RepID=A0ABR1JRB9_9AGAR